MSLIILLLLMAAALVPTLIFKKHLQSGIDAFRKGDLENTAARLEKAESIIFNPIFPNDAVRLLNTKGDLYYAQAEHAKKLTIFLKDMEKAEAAYRRATTIEPLNMDSYTGLTRATVALSRLYPFLKKEKWPHKPLPLFEKLLQLMPVNLYSHTLLMQYHEKNGGWDAFTKVAKRAVFLYPPLYHQLKKQTFYTREMEEEFKTVLQGNLEQDVYKNQALKVLSEIAYSERNYAEAIEYYQQTIEDIPYKDTSASWLRLGYLQLQAGHIQKAEKSYQTALKSPKREQYLSSIRKNYKKQNLHQEFLTLLEATEKKHPLSDLSHLLKAKSLMETEHWELARHHLLKVNSHKNKAKSHYLQAKIAKQNNDWDTMEVKAQRATVLEPTSSQYHFLFIQSLENQQKWQPAENAASLALKSITSNPWLYNKRAWLRWRIKEYQGAMEDWNEAVKISPRTADFYYHLAGGLEKIDNLPKAILEIKKALQLKPDNQKYQKRYRALQAKIQKEM